MKKIHASKVIRHFGGITKLTDLLNENGVAISKQAVWQWEYIPPARVLLIERLSQGKFPREKLRPDIFGTGP